jgi:soluble lytic murein transglycosylase-like protein
LLAAGIAAAPASCRSGPEPAPPGPAPVRPPAPSPSPGPAAAPSTAASAPVPPRESAPPWREEDLPRILAVLPLVERTAARHAIDPDLVCGIIWHESKFHADARGPGGAAGLMQLMPTVSRSLAKKLSLRHRPYDPEFNVAAGVYLLSRLVEKFDGDERTVLAAYALGSGRVRELLDAGEPFPERTERFIAKVQRTRDAFARAGLRERA